MAGLPVAVWRDILLGYERVSNPRPCWIKPEYVNKSELNVACALALLLDEYGFVSAFSPEFHRYLGDLGLACPSGVPKQMFSH